MVSLSEPSVVMLMRKAQDALYVVDKVFPRQRFDGSVLDVGCGRRGWLSLLIKSYFCSFVVTSDVEKEKVRVAKQIGKDVGVASDAYVVCDLAHLPFREMVFDKVVGQSILHHVLDCIDKVGAEIHRVLTVEGIGHFTGEIVASRAIGRLWHFFVLRKIPGEGIACREHWVKSFVKNGFSEVCVKSENLYGFKRNLRRGFYYWLVKHLPDKFVVDHLLTSATIVLSKRPCSQMTSTCSEDTGRTNYQHKLKKNNP